MYSTTLKKRFCKDTNIPINLFQEPYFFERLKLYDNVFNSLKKWKTFIHSLSIYNNEEEYLNYYNHIKDKIINDIQSKSDYIKFNEENMNNFKIYSKITSNNIFNSQNNNKIFISIDMNKANFSALHNYNSNIFNNKNSWEEYVSNFTNNEHIINSKYIRQVVLGNCNPKRCITYEKYLMSKFLNIISKYIDKELFVSFSNDEIIININLFYNEQKNIINNLIDDIKNFNVPLSIEVFKLHKIQCNNSSINGYIKQIYNLKDFYNINYNDDFKPISIKGLNSLFLPLVLRKLNNEEITENDKIFYHEGFLSKFIEVPNFIINDEVLGHFNKYKNTI